MSRDGFNGTFALISSPFLLPLSANLAGCDCSASGIARSWQHALSRITIHASLRVLALDVPGPCFATVTSPNRLHAARGRGANLGRGKWRPSSPEKISATRSSLSSLSALPVHFDHPRYRRGFLVNTTTLIIPWTYYLTYSRNCFDRHLHRATMMFDPSRDTNLPPLHACGLNRILGSQLRATENKLRKTEDGTFVQGSGSTFACSLLCIAGDHIVARYLLEQYKWTTVTFLTGGGYQHFPSAKFHLKRHAFPKLHSSWVHNSFRLRVSSFECWLRIGSQNHVWDQDHLSGWHTTSIHHSSS